MGPMYVFLVASLALVTCKSVPSEISNIPDTCNNLSFACQDLHIARKCKAVSACIEIWETIKVPKDNNEICDVCLEMVKEARDQLLSNETQEELKEVFEGSCNLLPIKAIAAECRSVVDEIVPEIIEMLASRMDPNQVCSVAGLCNNGLMKSLIKKQYVSAKPLSLPDVKNPGKCKTCIKGMTFIRKALKFIPENDFTTLLLNSCLEEFQGNHAQCNAFVKQAAPIVYNFLRVGDPGVFCSHMEHCPALSVPPPTFGDNMTCEFCEDLVQYVKNIVTSKSTEEEFRTAFQNMCKDLKEFSSECTTLVNEYFDQFYDFLVKNLEPSAVCSTLGLCDNSAVRDRIMLQLSPLKPVVPILLSKSEERQRMMNSNRPVDIKATKLTKSTSVKQPVKLQPAEKITSGIEVEESHNTKDRRLHRIPLTRIVESNSIDAMPVGGPNAFVQNDIECSLCKAAVMFLERGLESNKSEERIRKALDEVCTLFPSELNGQCQDFINAYTEMFVALIIQEANPNVVCAIVKVCTVEDAQLPRDFNEEYVKESRVKFVQCELCKKVMEYIENYVGSNKTEAQIKAALEKVCSELPATYSDKCKAFVDEYADIILTLLTKEVAPTMVCAALGLCPGENAPKGGGDVECTFCQYALHYLQNQLMDNATEEEIKEAVEGVCEKLPASLADNCEAFIEQYGASLIVMLAQKLDPSVICVDLKLCPAPAPPPKVVVQPTTNLPKLGKCDTCEMVVNYMDKILENDDVDSEVTKLVEKICTILPMSVREECAAIIDLYGPYILQMIGQVTDSKAVCQAIDLCSRSEKVQKLGAEKCTYGPSYWCQSTVHAATCNAHEYCRQKVWKM